MSADPVLSRELEALRLEISALRQERLPVGGAAPAGQEAGGSISGGAMPLPGIAPELTADDRDLREQLGELAGEITRFFEQGEKAISAHPIESTAGALLVGILIGRLLGHRCTGTPQ